MTTSAAYLRRHHVGLLALALILTGGVSYAAGALPKNSVKSAQVKNNSLTSKDLKNQSIKGIDVKDGKLTGADLAPGSVDEIRTVFISSNDGPVTLFDEPAAGTITFEVTCSPTYGVTAFASGGPAPARAGSYGLEQYRAPGEAADSSPLVGAATVTRLTPVGAPSGGAGFGGSNFGFGELVMFTQSTTKDVYARITPSYCGARAVISIDNKAPGTPFKRSGGDSGTTCVATGAAFCRTD
jgi:hypothetical protein